MFFHYLLLRLNEYVDYASAHKYVHFYIHIYVCTFANSGLFAKIFTRMKMYHA